MEGRYVSNNTEAYIQDNWKVNSKLTLDVGVRFVRQQPQYDSLGQGSNFLPDEWVAGQAPLLYVAGCANGVYPCSGTNRQAMHPDRASSWGRTRRWPSASSCRTRAFRPTASSSAARGS